MLKRKLSDTKAQRSIVVVVVVVVGGGGFAPAPAPLKERTIQQTKKKWRNRYSRAKAESNQNNKQSKTPARIAKKIERLSKWQMRMTRKWNWSEPRSEPDFTSLNCLCIWARGAYETMAANDDNMMRFLIPSAARLFCGLSQWGTTGTRNFDALPWCWVLSSTSPWVPLSRCRWTHWAPQWWLWPRHEVLLWRMSLIDPLSCWLRSARCWARGSWLWPLQASYDCDLWDQLSMILAFLMLTMVLPDPADVTMTSSSTSIGFELIQAVTLLSDILHDGLNSSFSRSWRNSPDLSMSCSRCGWWRLMRDITLSVGLTCWWVIILSKLQPHNESWLTHSNDRAHADSWTMTHSDCSETALCDLTRQWCAWGTREAWACWSEHDHHHPDRRACECDGSLLWIHASKLCPRPPCAWFLKWWHACHLLSLTSCSERTDVQLWGTHSDWLHHWSSWTSHRLNGRWGWSVLWRSRWSEESIDPGQSPLCLRDDQVLAFTRSSWMK